MSTENNINSLKIATELDNCEPAFLVEHKQLESLIHDLIHILESKWTASLEDMTVLFDSETILLSIQKILDRYQEQPYLLDKYLENLLSSIIGHLHAIIIQEYKDSITLNAQLSLNPFFKLVYLFTKVRGYKTILKFLTHDAYDLIPLISFLDSLDSKKTGLWETRYVILLWISLALMIPFDLKIMDQGDVIGKILSSLQAFVDYSGKECESSSIALARLITRKDTIQSALPKFLEWCILKLKHDRSVFLERGILLSICQIYKTAPRSLLNKMSPDVMTILDSCQHLESSLIRKLKVKLLQRVALSLLKPKIASWRYNRGKRRLHQTHNPQNEINDIVPDHSHGNNILENVSNKIEEETVPELVEDIISLILESLSDKDTVVRWSAAKGTGRICERLPKELAQEVIDSIVTSFEEGLKCDGETWDMSGVTDAVWHGGCLALAELARRGLLLPEQLPKILPFVWNSLKFDQKKGSHSIGAHVRDAASYVCWSFARAYAPQDIKNHIGPVAQQLITTSLFDREINVRRACSAAFQENVGRHGLFPYGIDMIHLTDYFLLGNKSQCFLELAIKVAEYEEYTDHVITHVANTSVVHWDKNIRELASKSLGLLSKSHLNTVLEKILPFLIPKTMSNDLIERHGCLLAVSEICFSLGNLMYASDSRNSIHEKYIQLFRTVISIVPGFDESYLSTFGSELTRIACLQLIEKLCTSNWPLLSSDFDFPLAWWEKKKENTIIGSFWLMIESSLARKEIPVQQAAVNAVSAVSHWLEKHDLHKLNDAALGRFLKLLNQSEDNVVRRGYVDGIGTFSLSAIKRSWENVVTSLVHSSIVNKKTQTLNDPEVRRNALSSLTKILDNLPLDWYSDHALKNSTLVYDCFMVNMEDYSSDSRGDVGSWIRQASMDGLKVLLLKDPQALNRWVTAEQATKALARILKQSVEKIDRIREHAGKIFLEIIYFEDGDVRFMFKEELRQLLSRFGTSEISWSSPSELYPVIVKILHFPEYRSSLLEGLLISMGGLSESLIRHVSESLINFIESLDFQDSEKNLSLAVDDLILEALQLLETNYKNDRVSNAILDSFIILLTSGVVWNLAESHSVLNKMFAIVKKELFKSKDVKKLSSGIQICCQLLTNQKSLDLDTKPLSDFVCKYLIHPFPAIRRLTAEELYIVLTSCTNEWNDYEKIEDLILTNSW